ncbi:MAG: lactonase family protein [Christiangramia sp.]|nr:6-phosphogluconolactonase [Christiangramia sp.]
MKKTVSTLFILMLMNLNAQESRFQPKDSVNKVYIGTYTQKEGHVDGKANGIYLLNQDPNTGSLQFKRTVAEVTNPSFVKAGRAGKYLFAVSELGPGEGETGFAYSYAIQPDGGLQQMSKVATNGLAPCHVTVDRSNKYAFVSNYLGGVVMLYKITENGELEVSQQVDIDDPEGAHTHSVKISGDNRTAYIADLGHDKIWIYDFDVQEGKLSPHFQPFVELPKGSGPRHLSFAKNGSFAYSANELNSSVSIFEVSNDGSLNLIQTLSSLPKDFSRKNSGADIHMHPNGKFLYASNRGHNSIAIFRIDAETGKLSPIDYVPIAGETPRNFAISPYGKFLYAASQDTGNITSYKIDEETGKLKIFPEIFPVKTPVCIEFLK